MIGCMVLRNYCHLVILWFEQTPKRNQGNPFLFFTLDKRYVTSFPLNKRAKQSVIVH